MSFSSKSPSSKKSSTKTNYSGRLSSRSSKSQNSDVSEFLQVSPVKSAVRRRTPCGATPTTKAGVKATTSLKLPLSVKEPLRKMELKDFTARARPAWSLKESLEDETPRSNFTGASTYILPRPSLDDFLNDVPAEEKELLQYLTADEKKTEVLVNHAASETEMELCEEDGDNDSDAGEHSISSWNTSLMRSKKTPLDNEGGNKKENVLGLNLMRSGNIRNKQSMQNATLSKGNVKKLNSVLNDEEISKAQAARTIQRWWRRIMECGRSRDTMQKIMEDKKQEIVEKLSSEKQTDMLNRGNDLEKIRRREEKARLARQKVIDEMHAKRERKDKPPRDKKMMKVDLNAINPLRIPRKVMTESLPMERISDKILEPARPDTSSTVGRMAEAIFESASTVSEGTHLQDFQEEASLDHRNSVGASTATTTFDDLMNTLKELEEEPLIKNTTFQPKKSPLTPDNDKISNLLSEDKLQSIMDFLDHVVKVEDDILSEVVSCTKEIYTGRPSPRAHNDMDSASQVASEISSAINAQKHEIGEKQKTLDMMKTAIVQQKEFSETQIREMSHEHQQQLSIQRQEYESTIKRHLSFIDQLIDDKKVLTQRCEDLVGKLKDMDQKYTTKIRQLNESHAMQLKKQKEIAEASEKLRREKWVQEKTQEIKEMTVKGLEPDIQRLIAKHKAEIKKVKAMKQGEVLEADERVGRRYIQQMDELRGQLEKEKEMAVRKERENARIKVENQVREEEESFQQQRRRLFAEVEEEKKRLHEEFLQRKTEFDQRQDACESSHKHTLLANQEDHVKKLRELQRTHENDLRNYKDQVEIEKQQWIENYMKKQETHLLVKERELKEGVRESRDKEIEMVIERLEQETALNREEAERTAENRIKRIRDKYESEIREYESSERALHDKCHNLKERLEDVENDVIMLKSGLKQKEQELSDVNKLSTRLQEERGKVGDVVRQEFADRLVALEEESKRLRGELMEEKSRHRMDVERVNRDKEDEMDEVHKRVKRAISKKDETTSLLRQQLTAAEKRAEHLEQLLSEQRKKILGK